MEEVVARRVFCPIANSINATLSLDACLKVTCDKSRKNKAFASKSEYTKASLPSVNSKSPGARFLPPNIKLEVQVTCFQFKKKELQYRGAIALTLMYPAGMFSIWIAYAMTNWDHERDTRAQERGSKRDQNTQTVAVCYLISLSMFLAGLKRQLQKGVQKNPSYSFKDGPWPSRTSGAWHPGRQESFLVPWPS